MNPIISAIKEIDDDIITKVKYINYNNKILSLDEQNNIQMFNANKYNIELKNIAKYENNKELKTNNDLLKLNDNNDTITFENNKIVTITKHVDKIDQID
jgi:hypothetical protein